MAYQRKNLDDLYADSKNKRTISSNRQITADRASAPLDTTAYYNMLNGLLRSNALANLGKNQYQDSKALLNAATQLHNARGIAQKYGIGGQDLDSYLYGVTRNALQQGDFMRQFTGQQDYNQRYAYPQTVKGKTDAEIEAMLGAMGTAMGVDNPGAYDEWLSNYYRNNTETGVGNRIGFNQYRTDKLAAMIGALEGKTYEPVKTQAWLDAQADVERYSDSTVPQHILDAQAAADATYADNQRLLDVYNRGVSGQQLTAEEQALFDSYTGSNDAWGRFVQEIAANDASMQDIMGKMNAMGETTQQNHALINGGYEYYLTGNTEDVQALNAAKVAEREAQAALDAYDDAHDARIAAMPEVQDTFDTSKLWADIDGADSDDRKALEDALNKAKQAVRQAESAAKTGYNEALLRAKIDVPRAESEAAELVKEYMGLAATGKSLEEQKRNEARPEAVAKEDLVGAYNTERLQNLASAGEIVMNERYKAEQVAAQQAMADSELINQYEGEMDKLAMERMELVALQQAANVRSQYNKAAQDPNFKRDAAYDSSNGDEFYIWLNTHGTSRETGNKMYMGMENAANLDADEIRTSLYQDEGYTFLMPDELEMYNRTYKLEGADAAQAFLNAFRDVRLARRQSALNENWEDYSSENGIWASVVGRGTNLAAGLTYPVQLLDAALNPDHTRYSTLYDFNVMTGAIDKVQSQAWDDALSINGKPIEFMGDTLGNRLYGGFTSILDMGTALGVGGLVGGAAGSAAAAKTFTMGVMMSEAGSNTLKNALDRGIPVGQAAALSAASAAIEMLTEKYSIEALFKSPKNAARYIAQNFATEGSEEFVSNWANAIVDLLINADYSELAQAAEKDGWTTALLNQLQSAGLDAIMGGLTGAIMSGTKVAGSAALNTAYDVSNTIKTGKQINTNQTYKQLHDIAVAMPEGSKARKIAQGNDKLNNRKAGQLYNALMEELDAKYQTSVRKSMVTDIKGRLQELGAQGDTTQVAEAIQKAWMGEKLSARESDLIAQNKLAMQVQHELLDLEEGWAEKAQETASKQRRETLTQMLDVERLASKGYKPAQDDAAAKAISKNASTTYANADQEKGLNTTAYTKGGTTVEIKRIEEQDGKAVYLVEKDGQDVTYAINDLELDSVNTENLVQPLKRGKMSVQAANTMMQFYATSGLSAPLYAKGFMVAYNAGVQRIGMAYVNNNSYSKALSPEVRKAAFDAGMADTKDEAPTVTKRKGRVTVDKSIDKANLTDNQKASIRAMEKLAKALHIDIEFFASKADAAGSYAAYENGSFRDGVIRLDINAGRDNSTDVTEFAILRTASHELTHYIAEASPQMYRELQAFVVDHLLEKGESLQTLMDRKKARESRAMSDEAALEEVIADACEMMLKDSTAIDTLARENTTLFEKIADWLRDFFDKIREAFSGVEAVHAEARALMEADADGVMRYIDGLQALWDKALVDAAHNVSAVADVGAVYDASTESAAPTMYSLRTWNESEYMANKKKAAEELSTALGVSKSKAMRWIDDINGIAKMVADNKELLDYEANEFTSAIKSNAEYGGSVDFSTICTKRRLATGTLDAIQRALRNSVLTQDDIFRIRNMMLDKGYEVACGLCYVESARKDFGRYAKAFLDEYKQTNPAWIPDMADVNTVDGLDDMRREHPEAYAAYEKYMNKLAQRKPKLYEKRTEYRNEILKKFKGDDTVSKKNLAGGFRIQSFSDFEIVHLLDMMQVIMDMSHVGLAGQAYTKVPDFAWALGDTGLKINLSMIAKGVKDGKIVFDEREGMKVAEAKALRDRYSKNVGTILVVFSDAQLKAALNDDFIDFIIPFHRSQWSKKNYGALGLPTDTRDFTSQQNERYLKPHYNERGKRIRPVNYSPNAYWDYSKSGKENAETYLRMCAEDGRRPKFAKLLVDNGDGSYSLQADGSTDGYWKLLIDFKMYDNDGNGSPQLPVQPNFNMEQAQRMLTEYKGGHAAYPVAQDIVDEFVSEYRGEKFSTREVDGNKVVWVNDNILANKPAEQSAKAYIKDYLISHIDEVYTIIESGSKVYPAKQLPKEYIYSKYARSVERLDRKLFGAKLKMVPGIGEMIEIATNRRWEKAKHQHNKDAKYGVYRYDTRVAFPTGKGADAYTAELVILNASDGKKYLYDIVNIKTDDVTAQRLMVKARVGGNAALQTNVVKDSILQDENDVNWKKQARDADTISSREALANALETAAKNDLERGLLADYKKVIQSLDEDQEKLAGHQKIIRELSFKKGGLSQQEKDELAMAKNRAEIVRNRLNRNDKKLLKLEATEALKAVVARERVVAERKIRDKKDKQLAEYRERTRDTLTRSALRDRIKHDVKTLNRLLLNETDVKHVPEELKGAVAQFLTVFTQDTSVFDQKKLDDLRYAYGKISDKNAANEDLPDISAQYDWDIANMMDDLREILPGRRLSELTQEETRKIRDIVQHFKFIVKESSRLFYEKRSESLSANGQAMIEEADKERPFKGSDQNYLRTMLTKGMVTPSYFFKKLGGVGKKLFDDLKAGESKYGLRVAQSQAYFDAVAAKYNYDSWRNEKGDVLEMTTEEGHKIALTREQALGFYATWNRENSDNGQNARHLSEGGFIYESAMKKDKKTGKIAEIDTREPNKMSKADMDKVANWLTNEQKAFANELVRYLSKDMARLGNEVSMKLFGIEKYTEDRYYPYQTSKNHRYTALGQGAATSDQRLKHWSATHRVTQFANNPIIASDFTTVWLGHVNQMILYSSMCVPLENLNRVYNYKYTDENGKQHSVKQSLQNAYGEQALKYIEQLATDLNGGVSVKGDGIMSRLTGRFKKSAVMLSLSVAIQQPSAVVRAMALVNPKYFAPGISMEGDWEELRKYSGIAVIKEMGGFDTSTGLSAQEWIGGNRVDTKREKAMQALDKAGGWLPEKMDKLAWVAIWKAVKAETRDATQFDVNSTEFLEEAARRFEEVIGYTQVYDSVLSKSQMMRNHALDAVTAFMSEPTLTYNMLLDAFTNRGKADSVHPARAVAAFVSTTLVNAMLKSLVTAARDDEEKNYLEKYAKEFTSNFLGDLNPLNLIPYARDIVSIWQGFDVERPDMSLASDMINGGRRGIKAISEDGDWYTGIKEIAGPLGGIAGIPVKNVWRDTEAVYRVLRETFAAFTGNAKAVSSNGMKYSILEALPFYGSTPTDYYSRRLDAMLEGDASELESLTMHLETGLGKAAKTVKSKTKEELGKRYKAGKIGDAEATDILMGYFEMDADEAYWQLKEWREKEAHKDEDDYSFSRTDDLKEALLSGKTTQIEAAKTELAGVGGYTEKEVVSKAKSAIKSLYVDGQITLDKAMKLLQDQAGDMTQDDLYWTEQEWAYEKANPDGEWNKFMGAHAAIESGKGAKQAAKELLTHGVEKGDAARAIATRWKATYVSLYNTDRKAALDLHSRILDMYVALGYSRSYQIKYIKDHWFE